MTKSGDTTFLGDVTLVGGEIIARTNGRLQWSAAGGNITLRPDGGSACVLNFQGSTGTDIGKIEVQADRIIFEDSGGAAIFDVNQTRSLASNDLVVTQVTELGKYTVATLPSQVAGGFIFVTDETGGAVTAFSDGNNWRRTTDRAVVS